MPRVSSAKSCTPCSPPGTGTLDSPGRLDVVASSPAARSRRSRVVQIAGFSGRAPYQDFTVSAARRRPCTSARSLRRSPPRKDADHVCADLRQPELAKIPAERILSPHRQAWISRLRGREDVYGTNHGPTVNGIPVPVATPAQPDRSSGRSRLRRGRALCGVQATRTCGRHTSAFFETRRSLWRRQTAPLPPR